MKNGQKVTMEPELEQIAGDLTASELKAMARKMRRWIRQLEIKAFILDRDAGPRRRVSLPRVSQRHLILN